MRLGSHILGKGFLVCGKGTETWRRQRGPTFPSFGLAESLHVLMPSILVHRPFALYAGATATVGTVLQAEEAMVSALVLFSANELCGEVMVFQTLEYRGSASS